MRSRNVWTGDKPMQNVIKAKWLTRCCKQVTNKNCSTSARWSTWCCKQETNKNHTKDRKTLHISFAHSFIHSSGKYTFIWKFLSLREQVHIHLGITHSSDKVHILWERYSRTIFLLTSSFGVSWSSTYTYLLRTYWRLVVTNAEKW